MNKFIGIEYGRGCLVHAIDGGCALATGAVQHMFPNADWTVVRADPFDADECARDRFGENFEIQKKIYAATPHGRHILIGGDHSVNFGHFAAIADQMPGADLCLIYIDAHFDIHNPQTARVQASGAPHGTNVRALLGDGDERWISLMKRRPALKPENLFYLGTRSFESEEAYFVMKNKIFNRGAHILRTPDDWAKAVDKIRGHIGNRPYVLSFDFDAIDPLLFRDVLVPATDGISYDAAKFLLGQLAPDAVSVEFVEYAPTGDLNCSAIVKNLISLVV